MRFLSVRKAREFRSKSMNESVIIKNAGETPVGKNCFLSHSSKDKESLADVIGFLSSFGARVYIDKEDDLLPTSTSRKTAEGLKSRIRECNRLVILASTNSKSSRWIPWEIGLADGIKEFGSIAILPLTTGDDESASNWLEQEYFCLYHQIVESTFTGASQAEWMARDPIAQTGIALKKWFA